MQNNKNIINIICINNDEYTIFTTVMLKSLLLNHGTEEKLNVYILHDGINLFNKNNLEKAIACENVSINWIYINNNLLIHLGLPAIYTSLQIHYYKLFMAHVLPENTPKALFIDSDMVILEEISKLWNVGLDGAILAAVQDARIKVISNDQAIRNYKALNIPADSHYFNTGVMLIDLPGWRKERISERSLECLEANKDYVHNREQYALNVIFLNLWKELDSCWNQFPETKKITPCIIHYAGWWAKTFDESYKKNLPEEFFYYAERTSWNSGNVKAEIERRARVRAIKVFLVKVLRKLKLKK